VVLHNLLGKLDHLFQQHGLHIGPQLGGCLRQAPGFGERPIRSDVGVDPADALRQLPLELILHADAFLEEDVELLHTVLSSLEVLVQGVVADVLLALKLSSLIQNSEFMNARSLTQKCCV